MEQMIDQCTKMMRMMGSGMMGSGMMSGNMMGGMMAGMMWPALLGGLLIAVLIAAGIVLLVRAARRPAPGARTAPLEILRERFARGEIDIEQYQQRASVLQER